MELKKHYTNEQTGISYTLHGDFYLPDIKPVEEEITLGKWGMMHKNYLLKYKKAQFNIMLSKGTLWSYLVDIDHQANEMYDLLIELMKEAEGVTEQLKEKNQMEWIGRINNILNRATEIVNNELIFK